MEKIALIPTIISIFLSSAALAEDCKTSCGDQCRVVLPPPKICSPFGGCVQIGGGASFISPDCNLKCETAKAAACITHTTFPTVSTTPVEITKTIGQTTCTIPFQVFAQGISASCGFNGVPSQQDNQLIAQAKDILITRGYFTAADFQGISIYWCSLSEADGIVPDRDLVYLHPDLKTKGIEQLTSVLGHEMVHVRQYRVNGTDKFKCDYVRQYAACSGANIGRGVNCQDGQHNSYEREAYALQDTILDDLENHMAAVQPQRVVISSEAGVDISKYSNPLINNRTIDACIKSNQFPDSSGNQCSSQAQRMITDAFCKQNGRETSTIWNSVDTRTFQHSYKYHLEDGVNHGAVWVADDTGGAIFTEIDCK